MSSGERIAQAVNPDTGKIRSGIFFVSSVKEDGGSFLVGLRGKEGTVHLRLPAALELRTSWRLSQMSDGRIHLLAERAEASGDSALRMPVADISLGQLPRGFETLPAFVGDPLVFSQRLVPLLQEYLLKLEPEALLRYLRAPQFGKLLLSTQSTKAQEPDSISSTILHLAVYLLHSGLGVEKEVPGLERLFQIFFRRSWDEEASEPGEEEDLLSLLRVLQRRLPPGRPRVYFYSLLHSGRRVGIARIGIPPGKISPGQLELHFFPGSQVSVSALWQEPERTLMSILLAAGAKEPGKLALERELRTFGFSSLELKREK